MLTLLKNIDLYCPEHIGKRDICIVSDQIYKIMPAGTCRESDFFETIIPCDDFLAFPGFIDQHVHLIGGGGEQGFGSRISEIDMREILLAGITTVVGLLGADGYTRSLNSLYAKAKALELQGITAYIYSGSYAVPPVTFTGSLIKDLILIDKVIGAGEIAISDHRSSGPDVRELVRLASEAHLGGLIGAKAGVLHLHVGDGKEGLNPLFSLIQNSDVPAEQLVPTHLNRNPGLFRQAMDYCRAGGNIDLTAGEKAGLSVSEAVKKLIENGIDLGKVTVSSDANGSIPGGGAAKIQVLYDDIFNLIKDSVLKPEDAIRLVTENVSRRLKLFPQKGVLREGGDADLLITDQSFRLRMLFAKGRLLVEDGRPLEKRESAGKPT